MTTAQQLAEEAKRQMLAATNASFLQGQHHSSEWFEEFVAAKKAAHDAIDALATLASGGQQATCQGDPGECSFNGACMYNCGQQSAPTPLSDERVLEVLQAGQDAWPVLMGAIPLSELGAFARALLAEAAKEKT